MKRVVFVLPGLVGEESILREFGAWEPLVEAGRVVRLKSFEGQGLREAAYLGLEPDRVDAAPGPLLVASLKQEPPTRSVQFVLNLMSVDEDGVLGWAEDVTGEELREVTLQFEKLRTKVLVPIVGRGVDHALVWEDGSLDLGVTAASEAIGSAWNSCLPEGDGERMLRGLIEDSLNLFDELEINKRRVGEGMKPLNILWPWGFGFRPDVPNLALRRGLTTVYAEPFVLQGLARLVGYRVGEERMRAGVHLRPAVLDSVREAGDGVVLVSPKAEEMRRHGRLDELVFEVSQFWEFLGSRLWEDREEDPFVLAVVGPGVDGGEGLALVVESGRRGDAAFPFDERVMDDGRVPVRTVAEVVSGVLGG